jgi:hypothetical protein
MKWTYKGHQVDELPECVMGMVYKIFYTDGTQYVGSKVIRSERRVKPLVGMRSNAVRKVVKESKWRDYEGSSKLTKDKVILSKVILYLTTSKRTMTYLEQRELFQIDAATNPNYVNENIGGKFYDNCLDGLYEGSVNTTGGLFDGHH